MIFNSYCEQSDLSVADGQGFKSLVGWISVYRTLSDYQKNEQLRCYHLVICVFIKNLKQIIYFNRMTIWNIFFYEEINMKIIEEERPNIIPQVYRRDRRQG